MHAPPASYGQRGVRTEGSPVTYLRDGTPIRQHNAAA
jgi:hypothetical protein